MNLADICEKALSRMESLGLHLSTDNLVFEEKTNQLYAEENLKRSLVGLSSTEQEEKRSSLLERLRNKGTLGYCRPVLHERQIRFHIGVVREKPLADLLHSRDEESAVTSLVHELAHAWFDQHTPFGQKQTSAVAKYENSKQQVISIWDGVINGLVSIFPPDLDNVRVSEAHRDMRRNSCPMTPESYQEFFQAATQYIRCGAAAVQRKSASGCPSLTDAINKAYEFFNDSHEVKITEAYTRLLNALNILNDIRDEERLLEGWAYYVESVPLKKSRGFFIDGAERWYLRQDAKARVSSALKSQRKKGGGPSEVLSEYNRTVGYSKAIQGYFLFSIFPSLEEAKSAVVSLNSDTELLQAVLPYVDRRYRRK